MLIARHFPIVRFEDGEKRWFNPVSKTRVADRPEERVRLRMVEYLVREAGFSLNHITTEMPVKISRDQHALRADILCFDDLLRPLLLVECKSETVPINEKTAQQSAGYNRNIGAPHVLLTNGIRDVLYSLRENAPPLVHRDIEERFPRMVEPPRTIAYWQERGLWGTLTQGDDDAENERQTAVIEAYLRSFWETSAGHTQYVQLQLPEVAAGVVNVASNQAFFARVGVDERSATGTSGQRSATGIFATPERRTIGIRITISGDGARRTTVFEPHLERHGRAWRVSEVIRWDG